MKCINCGSKPLGGFMVTSDETINGRHINIMFASGYPTEEMKAAQSLCGKACLMEWFNAQVDVLMGIRTAVHMGDCDGRD